jgi:hypothetical protein
MNRRAIPFWEKARLESRTPQNAKNARQDGAPPRVCQWLANWG